MEALAYVSGVTILIVGSVVKSKALDYDDVYNVRLVESVAILLIVIGCFVTVITFFGCCGAIRESRCMLHTFAVILALVFIIELSGGIAAFVFRSDIESVVHKQMNDSLQLAVKGEEGPIISWDRMQEDMKCCGVDNYSDWGVAVPESCQNKADNDSYWTDGCFSEIYEAVYHNLYLIGGIGVAIAFVQILGIICACCLANSIKHG